MYHTRIDGFPVTNISVHVIAPAREITTSEAAYAISSSCKNLHKKDQFKLWESLWDTEYWTDATKYRVWTCTRTVYHVGSIAWILEQAMQIRRITCSNPIDWIIWKRDKVIRIIKTRTAWSLYNEQRMSYLLSLLNTSHVAHWILHMILQWLWVQPYFKSMQKLCVPTILNKNRSQQEPTNPAGAIRKKMRERK
jgi:hypothetical protein